MNQARVCNSTIGLAEISELSRLSTLCGPRRDGTLTSHQHLTPHGQMLDLLDRKMLLEGLMRQRPMPPEYVYGFSPEPLVEIPLAARTV